MELGHMFNFASGPSRPVCTCLAFRYPADLGFKPDAGESHVIEWAGKQVHDRLWKNGWFTSLWRSDSGIAYVTDSDGKLYAIPPHADGGRIRTYDVAGLPRGVWGLDDTNVWVWGQKGGEGIIHHFDGSKITEMPCPGKVMWIHGTAPDFLVAVGDRGLVSRWDGSQWHDFPPVSNALMTSVHVVSPDEMYACGPGKEIWDGSVHGWSLRYRHDGPLGFIAKWQDRIWVAAGGDYGLSELIDDRLESRKPNLTSTYLDYRDELVVSCPEIIAGTADGENYRGRKVGAFADLIANISPSF